MKITTVLFYRESHNSNRIELRYYPSIELANLAAEHMIAQFKYWGGGSIPETIIQHKQTTKGCKTLYHKDFDSAEWKPYARETGNNIYGYYQDLHSVRATA